MDTNITLTTKIIGVIATDAGAKDLALRRFVANQKYPFHLLTLEEPKNFDSQIINLQYQIKNTRDPEKKQEILQVLEKTVSCACSGENKEKNTYIIYTHPPGRLAHEELHNHAKWMGECLREAGLLAEICELRAIENGQSKTFTNQDVEEFTAILSQILDMGSVPTF